MAVHRAAVASFTHDESYSYMYYPRYPVAEILEHTDAFTNNHLLNSLGMKVSEQWFGTSELALRAPNLFALVLFLVHGALFLRALPLVPCVLGYPFLIGNTYVMEFFILARGYGLSFGFMMMAVHHLYKATTTRQLGHLVLFHLASILASAASFALLGTHIAGIITYSIATGLSIREGSATWGTLTKGTIVNVAMSALAVALLYGPITNVMTQNTLDFGGKGDFYDTTVATWALSMVPGHPDGSAVFKAAQILIVCAAVGAVAVLVRRYRRGDPGSVPKWTAALFVVTSMLLLSCLGAELQHLLFGVDRLVQRFALFLVPLFALVFILLAAELARGRARPVVHLTLGLVAVHAAISFLRGFGPYRSFEWQFDVNNKQAFQAVLHDLEARPLGQAPASVGGNWLFEPAWNFYQQTGASQILGRWDRGRSMEPADFRLLLPSDPADMHTGYHEIARFAESGCIVLRRNVEHHPMAAP